MTRQGDDFRAQLLTLRGKLLDAIAQGRVGDVEVGFETYEQVVIGGFEFFEDVMSQLGYTPSTREEVTAAHPEWRWVQRDIAEFTVAAFEATHRATRRELIDLVYGIVSGALSHRQFTAVNEFLARLVDLWTAAVSTDDAESRGQILIDLHNLGEIQLPVLLRGASGDVVSDDVAWLAKVLIRTWTDMLKSAIDAGAEQPFRIAFEYFVGTFDTWNRRSGFPDITPTKDAAVLALLAWLDLRHPALDGEARKLFESILRTYSLRGVWQALREILDDDVQALMRWDWWELGQTRPGKAIAIQFDTAALRAAGTLVGTRRMRLPRDPDERDEHIARRLRDLEVLPEGAALTAIEELIAQRDAAERMALQDAPLDQSRIDEFVRGVREALVTGRSLLTLLGSPVIDDHPPPSEGGRLGLNAAVPRYYFVSTNVYADPYELGREAGASIRSGEDEQVLNRLRDVSNDAVVTTTVSAIASEVESAAAELGDVVVAVIASAQVAEALAGLDATSSLAMHQIWSDTDEGVVYVAKRVDYVRRYTPLEVELKPLPDVGAAVGVVDPLSTYEHPTAVIRVETHLEWVHEPRATDIKRFVVSDAEW